MMEFALSAGQESEPARIFRFRICFLGPLLVPDGPMSGSLETDSETETHMLRIFEKCYKEKEEPHWAGEKSK